MIVMSIAITITDKQGNEINYDEVKRTFFPTLRGSLYVI